VHRGGSILSITESEWHDVEKAYGFKLPQEVRDCIRAITISFVDWEVFERRAQPLSLSIRRAEAIKKATTGLLGTLTERTNEAQVYCDHLIKKHFDGPWPSPRIRKRRTRNLKEDFAGALASLSRACALALQEMQKSDLPRFREGDSWDEWIRSLTKIMNKNRLPVGAMKGYDKSTKDSPFVLLVKTLQNCGGFPPGARRHHHSSQALAQGITRARSNTARKGS
jgi:hypothetical protein